MPGSLRRRGFGILALTALAACAGERGEGSAGVAARGENDTAVAGADAEAVARSASAPATGEPATTVAPSDTATAGETGPATAVQPPDPLAMDSLLPPRPDGPDARRLAAEGARVFRAKGCTRCHTVGNGDRDGPDLAGVTERRSYAWIVMMLTQPEYMVQADHTAQQLLIEHFLEMPNLDITVEEARALWAYLAAGGR
ncbi:MAG TPA: c-type cytochrome [Longimicrobiales bacterium]